MGIVFVKWMRAPRVKDSRSGALEKERPPGGRLRTSRAQRASLEPRRDGRPAMHNPVTLGSPGKMLRR